LASDRVEPLPQVSGIGQIFGATILRIGAADGSEQRDLRTTCAQRSCHPLCHPSTVVRNDDKIVRSDQTSTLRQRRILYFEQKPGDVLGLDGGRLGPRVECRFPEPGCDWHGDAADQGSRRVRDHTERFRGAQLSHDVVQFNTTTAQNAAAEFSDDLDALNGVNSKIGLNVHIKVEQLRRVPGAFAHDLDQLVPQIGIVRRSMFGGTRVRRIMSRRIRFRRIVFPCFRRSLRLRDPGTALGRRGGRSRCALVARVRRPSDVERPLGGAAR
jgi:hypothetical protein